MVEGTTPPATSGGHGEATSIRFFEQLYAIVVGIGLAVAVEQIIDPGRAGSPIAFEHVPVFIAYLNITFALAHSSVRYLELGYEDGLLGALGKGRVLADLVLGVGHFLWLITLSFLVTRPVLFVYVAIVMLVGRPIRDGILRLAGRKTLAFDDKVAVVHVVTVAFLGATLLTTELSGTSGDAPVFRGAVLVASLLYGLGLYLTAFPFFFGDRGQDSS